MTTFAVFCIISLLLFVTSLRYQHVKHMLNKILLIVIRVIDVTVVLLLVFSKKKTFIITNNHSFEICIHLTLTRFLSALTAYGQKRIYLDLDMHFDGIFFLRELFHFRPCW